jgi:hypothetical protein
MSAIYGITAVTRAGTRSFASDADLVNVTVDRRTARHDFSAVQERLHIRVGEHHRVLVSPPAKRIHATHASPDMLRRNARLVTMISGDIDENGVRHTSTLLLAAGDENGKASDGQQTTRTAAPRARATSRFASISTQAADCQASNVVCHEAS